MSRQSLPSTVHFIPLPIVPFLFIKSRRIAYFWMRDTILYSPPRIATLCHGIQSLIGETEPFEHNSKRVYHYKWPEIIIFLNYVIYISVLIRMKFQINVVHLTEKRTRISCQFINVPSLRSFTNLNLVLCMDNMKLKCC